jgi:hypothetical protein
LRAPTPPLSIVPNLLDGPGANVSVAELGFVLVDGLDSRFAGADGRMMGILVITPESFGRPVPVRVGPKALLPPAVTILPVEFATLIACGILA